MADLDTVIDELTTVLAAVDGIALAPTTPPEQLGELPMAVTYIGEGEFNYAASLGCIGLHTLVVDIHVGRSFLEEDEPVAREFIESVPKAVAGNMQMNGSCEHCLVRNYRYGRLGYGAEKTMGIRFQLEVKLKHSGFTITA